MHYLGSKEMSKRDNPFFDENFLNEVNQKVKANPNGYLHKPKVDFAVEALGCTYLHFGRIISSCSLQRRRNRFTPGNIKARVSSPIH